MFKLLMFLIILLTGTLVGTGLSWQWQNGNRRTIVVLVFFIALIGIILIASFQRG